LHHFWEIVVYMANTMIFAIAGLVISEKAFSNLEGYDFLYLLITYISVNIIRGISMLILIWPMNKTGIYQLDWRNAVLSTWGGLRGAVGLALAVMILGERAILCEHDVLGSKMLFHVAGIVVFTLCINGVTTGKVVAALKLDTVSMSKKRSMQRCFRDVANCSADKQQGLQRKREYRDCNWSVVRERCKDKIVDPHNAPEGGWACALPDPDKMEDACEHYCRCMHTAIEHEYEAGTMIPSSIRRMKAYLADVEDANEKGDLCFMDHKVLIPNFEFEGWKNSWRTSLAKTRRDWMVRAFDTGVGFLNAHRYCLSNIDKLCHRMQAASVVKDHCKREISHTVHLLDQYALKYPEVSMSVKTRNAARSVLNAMRNHISHMRHNGKLIPSDAAILTGQVEKNMKNLSKLESEIQAEDYEQTLREFCPWYTADQNMQSSLQTCWRGNVHTIKKGDKVVDKAKDGVGIWVCIAGVMRVQIGHATQTFGPGYSAGILGTISGHPGKFADVTAETDCVAAFFEARQIQSLMRASAVLNGAMWDEASRLTARCNLSVEQKFHSWSHVKIAKFAKTGFRAAVADNVQKAVDLPKGHISILVVGNWKEDKPHIKADDDGAPVREEGGEGPCILPSTMETAIFWGGPVLFTIPNPLTVTEQARAHWAKVGRALFVAQTIAALAGNHEAGKQAVREILDGRLRKMVHQALVDAETGKQGKQTFAGYGPKAVPPTHFGDHSAKPLHTQPDHLQHMMQAALEDEIGKKREEEAQRIREREEARLLRQPSVIPGGSPPQVHPLAPAQAIDRRSSQISSPSWFAGAQPSQVSLSPRGGPQPGPRSVQRASLPGGRGAGYQSNGSTQAPKRRGRHAKADDELGDTVWL